MSFQGVNFKNVEGEVVEIYAPSFTVYDSVNIKDTLKVRHLPKTFREYEKGRIIIKEQSTLRIKPLESYETNLILKARATLKN